MYVCVKLSDDSSSHVWELAHNLEIKKELHALKWLHNRNIDMHELAYGMVISPKIIPNLFRVQFNVLI